MFLVTWIESEEVNYRLVMKHELTSFIAIHCINSLDNHLMVQELNSYQNFTH
ncbi:hypothetical protein AAC978_14600 [Desulfitobacterium sp. THU1]|uniref:hypothetical protein n=1 Tax=Desulfitobacterium sp. THU1 TaxID=3138072 RepID=UPI00311FA23B